MKLFDEKIQVTCPSDYTEEAMEEVYSFLENVVENAIEEAKERIRTALRSRTDNKFSEVQVP